MWNRPDVSDLRRVAAFQHYTTRQLAPLTPNTDVLRVPAGRVLARAGRPVREIIVVLDGEIDIADARRDGPVVEPGVMIGGADSVARRAHSATVTTRTDGEVLVLAIPAFRWAVRYLPGLADRLSGVGSEAPAGEPSGVADPVGPWQAIQPVPAGAAGHVVA